MGLIVPYIIIPTETNLLLNPLHRDFERIQFWEPLPFSFDARLLKSQLTPVD
jgi:RES domain-containing protein